MLKELIKEEVKKVLEEEIRKVVRETIREIIRDDIAKEPKTKKEKIKKHKSRKELAEAVLEVLKQENKPMTSYEVVKTLEKFGIKENTKRVSTLLEYLYKNNKVKKIVIESEEAIMEMVEKNRIQKPHYRICLWYLPDIKMSFEEQVKLLKR